MIERSLLLVDGSNLMARAWFTMRNPTLATLPDKIRKMLVAACSRWPSTHLVVALDSAESFRRESIPGYKADRTDRRGPSTSEMTEALRPAFEGWNVAVREADGLEADDVIACLVRTAAESSCPVSILTKDTDLLQLVSDVDQVRVLWPVGKGEAEALFDAAETRTYLRSHKHFQAPIGPEHLLDLRTIAGGKDNLPRIEIRGEGIKPPYGFTTRRAAELLAGGTSLDRLTGPDAHLLKPREREWMEAGVADALERRELLRLRTDEEITGTGESVIARTALTDSIRHRPVVVPTMPAPAAVIGTRPPPRPATGPCRCGCGRQVLGRTGAFPGYAPHCAGERWARMKAGSAELVTPKALSG